MATLSPSSSVMCLVGVTPTSKSNKNSEFWCGNIHIKTSLIWTVLVYVSYEILAAALLTVAMTNNTITSSDMDFYTGILLLVTGILTQLGAIFALVYEEPIGFVGLICWQCILSIVMGMVIMHAVNFHSAYAVVLLSFSWVFNMVLTGVVIKIFSYYIRKQRLDSEMSNHLYNMV